MLRLLWDTNLNICPLAREQNCGIGAFEFFDGNAIRELREDSVIRAFRQAVLADRLEDATQLLDTHGDLSTPQSTTAAEFAGRPSAGTGAWWNACSNRDNSLGRSTEQG
jgi:hypothetical protein